MKYVIGNVDCEGMVGSAAMTPESAAQTTALSAKRMIWFLKAGDMALLPEAPAPELIAEVELVSMSQLGSCSYKSLAHGENGAVALLSSDAVCNELDRFAISLEPPEEIICYFPSARILRKQAALFSSNPILSCFMKQGGGELLNTKAFFRIAFNETAPMAKGYVCRTREELLESTLSLLDDGRDVILKQSLNAGGDGNVAICDAARSQHFGVSKVYVKGSRNEMRLLIENLWSRMGGVGIEEAVVVEEYCLARKVLFAEYEISRDFVKFLGDGELRVDPGSNGPSLLPGFLIPSQMDPSSRDAFLSAVWNVAEKCREMGYVGRINVDGVLCETGNIILTEINARFGGCSHVLHIARLLMGDDFITERVITTRSYVDCDELAVAVNLARDIRADSPGRGVVVANEDMNSSGTIQILTFGASVGECEEIEYEFIKRLKDHPMAWIENLSKLGANVS